MQLKIFGCAWVLEETICVESTGSNQPILMGTTRYGLTTKFTNNFCLLAFSTM